MKSDNNIDKLFKDKLFEKEFVLKDSYIADLEEKLDVEKSNKKLFLLILFFFIGGISLTYYLTTNDTKTIVKVEETNYSLENEGTENKILTIQKADTSANLKNPLALEDSNEFKVKRTKSLNDKNDTDSTSIEIKNIKDNSFNKNLKAVSSKSLLDINPNNKQDNSTPKSADFKNKKITDKKNPTSISSTNNTFPYETIAIDSIKLNPTNTNFKTNETQYLDSILNAKDETVLLVQNIENKPTENALNTLTNISSPETPSLKQNEDSLISIKSENKLIKSDTSSLNIVPEIDTSITLQNEESLLPKNDNLEVPDSTFSNDNLTKIDETNSTDETKAKKWSLSFFWGPASINKEISGNISTDYLAIRKAEETFILTPSFGARVNYNVNKNINLSLGLNTLNLGENVDYSTRYNISSIDTTYYYSYIDSVINNNGVWDTVTVQFSVDSILGYDTTAFNYIGNNRHSYIQIPFMLGYKFIFNKIGLNVRLGGSYGILVNSQNKYVSVALDNIQQETMRKSIINIAASTTISYQLKKFNVFVEPNYRLNISNSFNNKAVIQKYTAFGVNIGLSFDL